MKQALETVREKANKAVNKRHASVNYRSMMNTTSTDMGENSFIGAVV